LSWFVVLARTAVASPLRRRHALCVFAAFWVQIKNYLIMNFAEPLRFIVRVRLAARVCHA
jgi:hypothetical protein